MKVELGHSLTIYPFILYFSATSFFMFSVVCKLTDTLKSECITFPFIVASIFGCLKIPRNAQPGDWYITIEAKVGYMAGGKGIGTACDDADGL